MTPADSCKPPGGVSSSRRRVVFFDFVSHYGGGQQATVATAAALRRFYDVHVIDAYGVCEPYLAAWRACDIPVHVLQPDARDVVIGHRGAPLRRIGKVLAQLPSFWRIRTALRRTLRDLQPDVIWTNSPKALTLLSLADRPGDAVIGYYAHGWYRRQQLSAPGRWLVRKRADFVMAVSNATADQMVSWGVDRDRAHVVYNTMDIDEVATKAAAGLNAPLPGMERPVRLVCPGILIRTKGHHTAVEAAERLNERGVDFALWVVGDVGKGNTEAYLDGLRDRVRGAGIEDRVHFLGWRTDLAAIMSSATALVFPSHTEGLPRVVIEAMLLRCPAIVTPVGGIPDLILPQETGLLADIDDAEGFADAIERLHGDEALRSQLIQNAQMRARELMNEGHQVGLIRAAFEAEIAKRATAR